MIKLLGYLTCLGAVLVCALGNVGGALGLAALGLLAIWAGGGR